MDKDKDGRLNEAELTALFTLMFQWFHTQLAENQELASIPGPAMLKADVDAERHKAGAAWNIPPEGVDKAMFVSNWISFFSELESRHVTFRDINKIEAPKKAVVEAPKEESVQTL